MAKDDKDNLNRRDFLKLVGTAVVFTGLALDGCKDRSESGEVLPVDKKGDAPMVPRRRLGKTNVSIPCLSHGVMYDLVENQIVIYNGLKWGINMIDTSNGYAGGNSELGIGKFFGKNPEKRKDFFIVSKASRAKTPAEIEEKLQLSLQRMKTNYIDLYYGVHGLSDPSDLTDELRKWAEGAKKRGLIKFFGFSTHQNMAKCLMAASKLPWIDALMTSYNFRLMQDPRMQEAIAACHKADIGLIAMKVMGLSLKTDEDRDLVSAYMKKGVSEAQAKLKAVLEDKRIASACVTMNTVEQITTNASAVVNKKKLTRSDHEVLKQYALADCGNYCAGCSEICNGALPDAAPYISDIMRYLMYHNGYNERGMARELFAEIPAEARRRLHGLDYAMAEKRCPQGLPIGRLIAEAFQKLT
jgi:uncharacterized protein